MRWNTPIWDEMDLIFAVTYESDTPVPEGGESISEEDFDRILQVSEEDDER